MNEVAIPVTSYKQGILARLRLRWMLRKYKGQLATVRIETETGSYEIVGKIVSVGDGTADEGGE